jgi:hypothetical protein
VSLRRDGHDLRGDLCHHVRCVWIDLLHRSDGSRGLRGREHIVHMHPSHQYQYQYQYQYVDRYWLHGRPGMLRVFGYNLRRLGGAAVCDSAGWPN